MIFEIRDRGMALIGSVEIPDHKLENLGHETVVCVTAKGEDGKKARVFLSVRQDRSGLSCEMLCKQHRRDQVRTAVARFKKMLD